MEELKKHLDGKDIAVFDIGNVLLRFDQKEILRRLTPHDHTEKWYDALFGTEAVWPRFDTGLEENGQIARDAAIKAGLPQNADEVLNVVLHFHEVMRPMPLTKCIPELKNKGIRIYALTNYGEPSFTLAWEKFDFFRLFDGAVVSSREKLIKPDPAIFRLLCRRYQFSPEEALFVDDLKANCDSAAQCGFTVWNYPIPENF